MRRAKEDETSKEAADGIMRGRAYGRDGGIGHDHGGAVRVGHGHIRWEQGAYIYYGRRAGVDPDRT